MALRAIIQAIAPYVIGLGFLGYGAYKIKEHLGIKRAVRKLENNRWIDELKKSSKKI